MTASPAQVANDLAAQARFWDRRDDNVAQACRDCARVIRAMLAGDQIDGRTYFGLHRRLLNLEITWRTENETLWNSLTRGRQTLETLNRERRT